MKKIMFNDKYGLTEAVLEGRKTMTRRIVPQKLLECIRQYSHGDEDEFRYRLMANAPYSVGEIVAIAQSYQTLEREIERLGLPLNLKPDVYKHAGYKNKMFVKPEDMPHHIKITGIKVEGLAGISDEDCLKEGIEEHLKGVQYGFPSNIGYCGQYPFGTPRGAFAALIDKVSGKGTWESNPLVWVYEFKLID